PISLHVNDIDQLNEIIKRGRPLQKGEHLYRIGDPFSSVYAVRSGTIKASNITSRGEEHITGFYLPGEVLGMDGIATGQHTNAAIALETAAVCEIPFSQLEALSLKLPSLQRHFFQLMGKEIVTDQRIMTLLSKHSADERIAALLLSISTRNHNRHLSASSFRLPMSRSDIGNYLGLTLETVSRVLSRFQQNGLLTIDKREITIQKMDELKAIIDWSTH
ncbi:MAG: fumarate/nitrate reduction transcriptional regulator Fnr, partial [Gammaproteobacteria bacterium]